MAIPVLRSFTQIFKAMVQEYTFKSGVNDLNKGSSNRSFLEAAALSDYKTQGDIMAALASADIDRAENADLDKIGFAKKVARLQARESNGVVTIYQKDFTKVSTKVYQGTAAPPAGSATLNIADSAGLPTSGAVYVGRGTNNLEGPISYSSITSLGSYFQLNLVTPTTKNHNVGETVILAQGGNRIITAGSIVQTRSTLTSQSTTFRMINTVTLLDGESQITDVPVICTQVGKVGNIPTNAIVEFASEPFPNAAATNPLGFVSGRDVMSDPDYRELIKKTEQSRVKGTDLAIKQAAVNVQSTDDNQTVTSAEIRKPANRGEPSILFIDNSSGYQPIFSGQGFEQIIDNANGGEKYLQLQRQDLVRATVVSSIEAPFALTGGMTLSVRVGGVLSEHTFSSSDFSTEGAADTFEVVNSINNNPLLTFNARGFNNNKKIVLFAKQFKEEDIEISSPSINVDANLFLGFAKTLTYTLRLYKNDGLLIKDGIIPTIYSNAQNAWNASITNGATLKVQVDQTSFQSITVNDADFVPYGFATVNKDNALSAWANVLTRKIAGMTVEVEGNRLKMTSNLGAKDDARLEVSEDISGNSLANGDNMWEPQIAQGVTSDYSLNRATGQVELAKVAVAGDVFTAGSKYTRGFIDSGVFTAGSLTLTASPAPKIYFIVDNEAERIGVSLANTVAVTVTNPSGNTWRYTFSVAGVVSGIAKDDWVIITDNTSMSANNVGHWRVNSVDGAGTWFEIIKTTGTIEGPVALTGGNDFVFVRSPLGEPQSVTLPTGLQTLTAIANTIKTLDGLTAEVFGGKKVRVSTLSFDNNIGRIFLAAQNTNATTLGFVIGDTDTSEISHTAFNSSQDDLTFIEFFHDKIATGDNSFPYTSVTTVTDLDAAGYEPNNKTLFLNPYGVNVSSNRKMNGNIADINGINLSLRDSTKLREIIANDRYALGVPFNFNAIDNMVVVLDNDTINKTFNIKLGRRAKVYQSPNASTLKAYDLDFGPTANFPAGFGNNFNFADFKVHMKARVVIDPAGSNNRMMIRSASFGPSGNRTRVGIFYPQSESSAVSYSVSTGMNTDFKILLASGALRTGGTWDATTEFDVTNPAGDTWRYTWNTNGTAPNFLSAGILIGDIVNISAGSTFASENTGAYKLTGLTNTYFEVTNYNGSAETGNTLDSAASLRFFPLDPAQNTATLIGAFVNGNAQASEFITIAQLESGAGAVSTSTEQETAGASLYLDLKDGENWIASSSIGTTISPTNDFVLKRALTIFGSEFLNEEFYLIPTRSEQLNRFLNRFAVTGLSSLGNIAQASDSKALEIYSTLFGSSGTVFVTGGSGNTGNAAVTESAALSDSTFVKFAIAKAAASGFHAGQWIKVTNTEKLAKDTKFRAATQVTWDSANPSISTATISLPNSDASNIFQNGYFWTRRYHSADATTVIRVEKQGKFVALSHTGTGTAPNFVRTHTVSNVQRTSNISTVTVSAAHNVPVGSSVEVTISGAVVASFDGTFRAVADTTTSFQYRQDGLVNVGSTVSTGSAVRQVRKTDRINLSGAFNTANQGEFLVVGVYGANTLYIENDNAVEEDVTLAAGPNIKIYDYDSVRPGDTFSVGSTALDSLSPFESHKGEFIVSAITANENEIVINSTATQDVTAATLGSDFNTVKVIEEHEFLMYAKIRNVSVSPANSLNTDIVIEGTELPSKINQSAGSGISSVSKLGFDTSVKTGEDSYKYYGGLISAVGQKIRGRSSDPITYPGVAAAGSFIEVDAALPKRIQLSIVIRNRTGTPFSIVKSRVQSSVAAYVDSIGVGQPVVFSEIVVAAQAIDGVQAVAISSPTYNATNDQIISQPDQKPLILNIDQDIIVSQAT